MSRNTPIEKSGIRIGKVTKVQFAPNNDVLVTASVDGGIELFRDEAVQIKQSLLGEARLEFVPGPQRMVTGYASFSRAIFRRLGFGRSVAGVRQYRREFEQGGETLTDAGTEVGKLAKN